jgi:hypothetical protein
MPKRLVLVLILAALVSACDYLGSSRPPWLNYAVPAQPSAYNPAPSYSSYRRGRPAERVHIAHSRSTRESNPARSAEVENSRVNTDRASSAPAPAVSSPPVSISLAGDNGDRQRAQHLLEETDANLDRARAQHLTASQKETYRRASQLANRARRALADNDCAAASSLAGKAVSLAAGLGGQ